MAKEVTCPYCWTTVRVTGLNLRCPDACGPGGTTFPVSAAVKGKCAHGRTPLPRRFCPGDGCGRVLNRDYLEDDGARIAILGPTSAGKSIYLCVLLTELRGRMSQQFNGMSVDFHGQFSRELYEASRARLYDERVALRATRRRPAQAALRELDPLIFSLKIPSRRALGRIRIRSILSVVYDSAGEYVMSDDNIDRLGDYLATASAILLLIDPLRFPRVREHVRARQPGISTDQVTVDQTAVLERLTEVLRDQCGGKQIAIPMAVTLSKIDLVEDTFGDGAVLFTEPWHDGGYQEADGRNVHEEIRAWLEMWQGPEFDNKVAANFRRYRYFGVSALGDQPADDASLDHSGINPHRVEDPLLWLLAELGAVRSHRRASDSDRSTR